MTHDLPDRAVRERIRNSLDESLFVEAGAGSGKTTVLIDRICALVASGIPMREIAAVTFTEKAAAELRDRVRVGLEQMAAGTDDQMAGLARAALDELDGAAIGTLHSFAARILSEHAIQAGIPPLVQVLDEVASQVAFDRRWADTRTTLLDDPAVASALRIVLAAGGDLERHVRPLVTALDDNWDLVQEQLGGDHVSSTEFELDLSAVRQAAQQLLACAAECLDPADKLLARVESIQSWLAALDDAIDDPERLDLLAQAPKGGNLGRKDAWRCPVAEVRMRLTQLHDQAQRIRAAAVDQALRALTRRLARAVLAAADDRRAVGRLEFHDLLVLARAVLRDPQVGAEVRASLQRRYRRLLLDEFQDTDPIQVELALRIAAGTEGGAVDWRDVLVPAGSLFVVGDPKQSIYRFRRADIRTFLAARDHLGQSVSLTTNFRSTAPLLEWVNTVFGQLIGAEPGVQPAYVGLDPVPGRPDWQAFPDSARSAGSPNGDTAAGPPVVVLGSTAHLADGDVDLRALEARDVAGVAVRALTEGWRVEKQVAQGGWRRRPVRLSDICVLVPSRTSINALEAALDEAGVPYRTEATSLVYQSREVRDLLLAARAVDDPTDELALIATLRSALFGCGDDDLWRWRRAGGGWNVFRTPPDTISSKDVVAEAMAYLRRLARHKPYLSPSALLDRLVRDRRVLEAAVDSPRYRETWRRVRYAVDQARAWSEAEHGSLREYLRWAGRQAEETTRVSEVVLPETDADSIRIMTIHAAKGLQFPMVIVSGMTSRPPDPDLPVVWETDRDWQVRLRKGLETSGYTDAFEAERHMERCEELRLLYVACTRAESHLVVSCHRVEKPGSRSREDGARLTRAAMLAGGLVGATHEEWSAPDGLRLAPVTRRRTEPPPDWAAWSAAHEVALAAAERPAAVSASDIAHGRATVELPPGAIAGLAKEPRDLELPPWAKGRYGTAVGRAVHAVLQSVDLSTHTDGTPDGSLFDLAASAALAEGVAEHTSVVAALARSALDAHTVRLAAARPHWKETYVGTVVDDTLIEGYVDLLYQADDGSLVIADYKTDAAPTEETVRAYATQLGVYAHAVADATGEPVSSRVLVFCRQGTAAHELVLAGTD